MAIDQNKLRLLAREFNEIFVIPASTDELLDPIRALSGNAPPALAASAQAFCANIQSVVSTAGIPYKLVLAGSHQRRYQLLYLAAELQAVVDGVPDSTTGSSAVADFARQDAGKRAQDFAQSAEGRAALNHETCRLLLDLAKIDDVRDAAAQLNLQAALLTWGAFEALSRDVFRSHLNSRPRAYALLLADADLRRRFDLTRVSIERVADFNFDLSKTMGDLLVEQNDLADLGGIKATYAALFSTDESLRETLNRRELWLLFQRRSLIVHRQGVVDRRYLDASGDDQQLGSRLRISPSELKNYLRVVADAARRLLLAVVGCSQDVSPRSTA
jgi:hypothetical protein